MEVIIGDISGGCGYGGGCFYPKSFVICCRPPLSWGCGRIHFKRNFFRKQKRFGFGMRRRFN